MTLDEHRALGVRLKALHAELHATVLLLSHNYGPNHRSTVKARRLVKAYDQLRSELDDIVCRENPEEHGLTRIYYGEE